MADAVLNAFPCPQRLHRERELRESRPLSIVYIFIRDGNIDCFLKCLIVVLCGIILSKKTVCLYNMQKKKFVFVINYHLQIKLE